MAWREPSAWEGLTEVAGVRMPAPQMAVVALDELVLHGWDLARSTGQSFTCTPANTAAVLEFTHASAQPDRARDGLFGPVVDVPADAPAFDRALGFAGRDPAWSSALTGPVPNGTLTRAAGCVTPPGCAARGVALRPARCGGRPGR